MTQNAILSTNKGTFLAKFTYNAPKLTQTEEVFLLSIYSSRKDIQSKIAKQNRT